MRHVCRIAARGLSLLSLTVVLLSVAVPTVTSASRDARTGIGPLRYSDAERLARSELSAAEASFGSVSRQSAEALDRLVEVILERVTVDDSEAHALAERAVHSREQLFGPQDPGLLRGLDNLGRLALRAGRFDEARQAHERAVAIGEKSPGLHDRETSRALGGLAQALWGLGRLQDANAFCERALSLREKSLGPDHSEVADSLLELVRMLEVVTGNSRARSLVERALAIREKNFGPESPEAAEALVELGIVVRASGDFGAARTIIDRALAIYAGHPGAPPTAISRAERTLADTLIHLGDFAAALLNSKSALERIEPVLGPDHEEVAKTLLSLGSAHLGRGDYEIARELDERALATMERRYGLRHRVLVNFLNGLGRVELLTGDYDGARVLQEREVAILRALGPAYEKRLTYAAVNLAMTLRASGNHADARRLLEEAIAVIQRTFGPDHSLLGSALNSLANLNVELGNYGEARGLYVRALAILEKEYGPDHDQVSLALMNLANTLLYLHDTTRAAPLLNRALGIQEKNLGPNHIYTCTTLNYIGDLMRQTGDLAGAVRQYERALARFEKAAGPDSPRLLDGLNALGELHSALGQPDAARSSFEEGLRISRKTLPPFHPEIAKSLIGLAKLDLQMGAQRAALRGALQAEAISREHFRATARAMAEREALRYESVRTTGFDIALSVIASGAGVKTQDDLRRTWDEIVRSRAMVLDELAARHRALRGGTEPEGRALVGELQKARSALAQQLMRGPDQSHPENYRKQVALAVEERDRAERLLAELSGVYLGTAASSRMSLSDVTAGLPDGSALVAYVAYRQMAGDPRTPPKPAYVALVLESAQSRLSAVPLGPAEEIDALVRSWRDWVGRDPRGAASIAIAGEAAARRLREKIWDPVAARLARPSLVFVVPDGDLSLVALATLPVGGDRYLVDSAPPFHYLSAERDIVAGRGAGGLRGGVLVLGDPDFNAPPTGTGGDTAELDRADRVVAELRDPSESAVYRGPRAACADFRSLAFDALPSARLEAEEVESLWASRNVDVVKLTGPRADEGTFKRLASGRKILHIATHGFFLDDRCGSILDEESANGADPPDNPLTLSGLALAGANRRDELARGADAEDGILTAEEIASLDLSGVDWAVLSGCETGVGKVQAGEGVLGMRRAFEVAGAGTLIMSLWPVEDEETRLWMRDLYRGRADGLQTVQAMTRAMLNRLAAQRSRGESTHPHFWGAFVAAGDWR